MFTNSCFSRREMMRIAMASVGGASMSGWLPQLAKAAMEVRLAKACILLWMPGGPSQMETLDPKPGRPNGGPTQSIATSVPGIRIAENLPKIADLMKDLSIIRSMQTGEGDHGRATQLMQTGYKPTGDPIAYPVLGSMVAQTVVSAFLAVIGASGRFFGIWHLEIGISARTVTVTESGSVRG